MPACAAPRTPRGDRSGTPGLLIDRRGTIEIPELGIELASPAAIFVLKVVAWRDRPAERGKDLADLTTILEEYLPEEADRRYVEPPADQGWYQEEAAAWWLGHDVSQLCDEPVASIIRAFLIRLRDDEELASLVAARAPTSWRGSTAEVSARAAIMLSGMDWEPP